jgi:hypothetical protein
MKVYAFESDWWAEAESNGLARKKVVNKIETALHEVSKLLPTLSEQLNVVVRPHTKFIPEYGIGGYTHDSEYFDVTFDKTAQKGATAMLEYMHETVFHEANHAARWNSVDYDDRFIASVVFEGLATVFEREYTDADPLYGKYDNDQTMQQWFDELCEVVWDMYDEYFYNHPDGRRWIGYKTGTWLIDRAVENSGKSVIELTTLPIDEILGYADVGFDKKTE